MQVDLRGLMGRKVFWGIDQSKYSGEVIGWTVHEDGSISLHVVSAAGPSAGEVLTIGLALVKVVRSK